MWWSNNRARTNNQVVEKWGRGTYVSADPHQDKWEQPALTSNSQPFPAIPSNTMRTRYTLVLKAWPTSLRISPSRLVFYSQYTPPEVGYTEHLRILH